MSMATAHDITPSVLDEALAAHDAGMCVLPIAPNGTKRPIGQWKQYQAHRPDRSQVAEWFSTHQGLGIVTGAVSGGLEMFELEGTAVNDGTFEQFVSALHDNGLSDLWDRIVSGWMEYTPGGGVHVYYRWEPEASVLRPGNTKLATRPGTVPGEVETLIETRGEGGFTVVAPSCGTTHASGKPWVRVSGGPTQVATITPEERQALFSVARQFNVAPAPKAPPKRPTRPSNLDHESSWMDRVVADLEREPWGDVLGRYGWTYSHTSGDVDYWVRPGKDAREGHSACTNGTGSDRLVVFSSSTPFEPYDGTGQATSYDRLDVIAAYDHGGDRVAAAKAVGGHIRDEWMEQRKADRLAEVVDMRERRPSNGEPPKAPGGGEAKPKRGDADPYSAPGRRPCTDLGNAERLFDHHGQDLRYFVATKDWLVWDGTRWKVDDMLDVHRLAGAPMRAAIYLEAADEPDAQRRKELTKWAEQSQAASKIANAVTLAQPLLPVDAPQLDKDNWLLNTPSGTIQLRTGDLEPHDRNDMITRITKAPYSPTAKAPRWEAFLLEIMNGDEELVRYLQRAVGYTLTGDDSEQAMLLLIGDGANGKSTFVNTLADVLGDYAGTCGKDVIAGGIRKSQGAANEELVNLRGTRLVSATETEQGEPLAEAMVKRITGGETITARKLYGHNITFRPTFTLWLSTNHLPRIAGTDEGIWRRLKVVPFRRKFQSGQADPHLREKLMEEAEGILAWAVEGCLLWQQHGLGEPDVVRLATSSYREESDHVAQFLGEECETDPTFKENRKTLYGHYVKWCQDEGGQTPLSALEFKRTMERKGFPVSRVTYQGVYDYFFLGLRRRSALG